MNTITMNYGSDMTFNVTWPESIAGYSLDIIDAHASVLGHVDLTMTDASAGTFRGTLHWQDDMPLGRVMYFRVRLTSGEITKTTPRIYLEVV